MCRLTPGSGPPKTPLGDTNAAIPGGRWDSGWVAGPASTAFAGGVAVREPVPARGASESPADEGRSVSGADPDLFQELADHLVGVEELFSDLPRCPAVVCVCAPDASGAVNRVLQA